MFTLRTISQMAKLSGSIAIAILHACLLLQFDRCIIKVQMNMNQHLIPHHPFNLWNGLHCRHLTWFLRIYMKEDLYSLEAMMKLSIWKSFMEHLKQMVHKYRLPILSCHHLFEHVMQRAGKFEDDRCLNLKLHLYCYSL